MADDRITRTQTETITIDAKVAIGELTRNYNVELSLTAGADYKGSTGLVAAVKSHHHEGDATLLLIFDLAYRLKEIGIESLAIRV